MRQAREEERGERGRKGGRRGKRAGAKNRASGCLRFPSRGVLPDVYRYLGYAYANSDGSLAEVGSSFLACEHLRTYFVHGANHTTDSFYLNLCFSPSVDSAISACNDLRITKKFLV